MEPTEPSLSIETLTERVSARTSVPLDTVAKVIAATFAELRDDLRRFRWASLPELALVRVITKPATAARSGINPFTKEPMTIPARPGGVTVRAIPDAAIKALATRWDEAGELGAPFVDERFGKIEE